jgi:RNA polymerase sigma factor (sigma-70 family)
MIEDAELLRRYVRERSQDAFSELVRRPIDLVYSVALRHVGGDAHFAEDVTQKVFADLARKAPTLLDRPVLSGWLYRSAQYAASDVVRSERRRRAREQETYAMQDLTSDSTPVTDWDRLRPWLDEVMRDLSDPDRDAVALRFFEGKAFSDIGRVLRLTEEAARKRVDRALDKMEEDSGKLLSAIEGMTPAGSGRFAVSGFAVVPESDVADNGPITQELVELRYKRGKEAAARGDVAAALKEYLWCYDRGMVEVRSYYGVRNSFLLSDLARLGEPALTVLRQRRDAAEQQFAVQESTATAADVAGLNRALKEEARTMELFDQLPAQDPRRRILGRALFDEFIAAQRYRDAVGARSFEQMVEQFTYNTRTRVPPPNVRDPALLERSQRRYAVQSAAKFVEVLAGTGDLSRARDMAARLLAYDGSPETRQAIEQRAARAGHPDLLNGIRAP